MHRSPVALYVIYVTAPLCHLCYCANLTVFLLNWPQAHNHLQVKLEHIH